MPNIAQTKPSKPFAAVAASAALFMALASCTTNPATGKKDFTPFMSKSQEIQLGMQEHPKLMQQFGGAYQDPKVSGYVAKVGKSLSDVSELPDLDFTYTTLNSKVINAFALPGGFVYMSRGLLALMNDEAELASVLGHEVGHVTARHSANRYNRQMMTGILGMGVGIATGSGDLANLVSQGAQMYVLSYSRGQELQADELGVRYITRQSYDPFGAPRMLDSLGAQTSLDARILGREAASKIPAWARTHPLTSERVEVALREAREKSAGMSETKRNRNALLAALDGMRYDDDPTQGIINGREFKHGQLGFEFTVPDGFALENGTSQVTANGPNGAAILFSGGRAASNDMAAHATEIWKQLTNGQAAALSNLERIDVNGMAAATGNARVSSNNQALDFRVVSIAFAQGQAYSFVFVSPSNLTEQLSDPFRRTTYSFNKLSDAERSNVKGRVLKVATIQRGDTLSKLAGYMAYDAFQMERFLVLNGLEENAMLKAGDRVKIVVAER